MSEGGGVGGENWKKGARPGEEERYIIITSRFLAWKESHIHNLGKKRLSININALQYSTPSFFYLSQRGPSSSIYILKKKKPSAKNRSKTWMLSASSFFLRLVIIIMIIIITILANINALHIRSSYSIFRKGPSSFFLIIIFFYILLLPVDFLSSSQASYVDPPLTPVFTSPSSTSLHACLLVFAANCQPPTYPPPPALGHDLLNAWHRTGSVLRLRKSWNSVIELYDTFLHLSVDETVAGDITNARRMVSLSYIITE